MGYFALVRRRVIASALVAVTSSLAPIGAVKASAAESSPIAASVRAADTAAATHAASAGYHFMAARTIAGATSAAARSLEAMQAAKVAHIDVGARPAVTSTVLQFFPAALTFYSGPVIKTFVQHSAYVNATSGAPWGNPETFLTNLNASAFAHVIDQYVGSTANGRYPVGAAAAVSGSFGHIVSVASIQSIVHSAATKLHISGSGHIVHVYLQKGVDTCFDLSDTQCYSPDNPSSFVFCAYHTAVTFSDIGTVIYSVEPYQAVPGCGVDYGGIVPANSLLIDGTASVLSHELFEAITDPFPHGVASGSGWVASSSFPEYGYEIGDICQSFKAANSLLNGHNYTIQFEYSNRYGACANGP